MELDKIAGELDTVATWHTGSRRSKLADLANALWEHAGGRPKLAEGDPNAATPGPGVKAPTVVDSVGKVDDAPVDPPVPAGKPEIKAPAPGPGTEKPPLP